MKAAFLFSGQLRGFSHCVEDFQQLVFSSFDEVDTFFYIPSSDGKKIFDIMTPTSVLVEKDQTHREIPNFSNNICLSHQRSQQNNYEPLKHLQHYFLQWYGVKRVFELFDSYRSLNDLHYDVVFRVRPDIKFFKKLEFEPFNGIQTSDKSGSGGYYDRIAYGSYEHMQYYCSLYDRLFEGKYNSFEYSGNSESKLKQHIVSGAIDWKTNNLGFYQSVNIDGSYSE